MCVSVFVCVCVCVYVGVRAQVGDWKGVYLLDPYDGSKLTTVSNPYPNPALALILTLALALTTVSDPYLTHTFTWPSPLPSV